MCESSEDGKVEENERKVLTQTTQANAGGAIGLCAAVSTNTGHTGHDDWSVGGASGMAKTSSKCKNASSRLPAILDALMPDTISIGGIGLALPHVFE